MKKIVLFAMGLAANAAALAQENAETSIGADFVNQYIWRGQDLGSTAVQPTLGIACQGLSLTAWGSYALTNAADTKEFDLTLGYTIGGLNLGVTDYWFTEGPDPDGRYLKYDAHGTNHVFEANVGYDFGVASVQWYTNFAGNDGARQSGHRAYSSYVEVAAPFTLAGVGWTATVGAVPYATTFYDTSGFAVTNLALQATKDIRVTDSFHIPVFAQVSANPCSQHVYLVLGFTLHS